LLGAAGLSNRKICSADISFQIAPRLNASGRLKTESADTPLNLLLSSDRSTCGALAQIIENHNTKRKFLSRDLENKMDAIFSTIDPLPLVLFAFDSDIHLGVAGIAAGYLSRKYYLPAIVGQIDSDMTTASCRSIPEFNIISALDKYKDLFVRYGGHALAAGFTIPTRYLAELENRLNDLAEEMLMGKELQPTLSIDAEISLSQINSTFFKELDKLEPTGANNPLAIFVTRNLSAKQVKSIGQNKDHLKMSVFDGRFTQEAVGFGLGYLQNNLPVRFDLAYSLSINEYQGNRSFQLQIVDLKAA